VTLRSGAASVTAETPAERIGRLRNVSARASLNETTHLVRAARLAWRELGMDERRAAERGEDVKPRTSSRFL
jgi:hypothetical protein